MAICPSPALVAAVEFQSNWFDVVRSDFMRNAFAAGMLVAVAAGLIGYFVVIRQNAFAAHALAHIAFPGATGAVLVGAPIVAGLAVFCVGGGLAIGLLGKRLTDREVSTGTVLAFATGVGVLFNSLAGRNTGNVTNILFGNLLAVTGGQLAVFAVFTVGLAVVMAAIARPLTFASVNPDVAEAKGVPVRELGVAFTVLLALVVTMAVLVVGTLLLFGLVVTPFASALMVTPRPGRVALVGTGIAVFAVVAGLVLATMFNLPASFFIVALTSAVWLAVLLVTRRLDTAPAAIHSHHGAR